jgi:hypothetical protein
MLALVQSDTPSRQLKSADRYSEINAVKISGDQLNRAFQVEGALGDDRVTVLTTFARQERIAPLNHAAEALLLRMGLVADFLDGPGIENAEWNDTLEAIARVRLVDDADALPIGDSGICLDEAHFDELLAFIREIPW